MVLGTEKPRAQIYDCFPFFRELDILEIRLRELWPLVDRFVIVESTKTFTGHPKSLFYLDHRERFKQFADKITHVVVDDMPQGDSYKSNWDRELHQRDSIARGVESANPDDWIIISDVDEIPKPQMLRLAVADSRRLTFFLCDQFRLRLNLRSSENSHLGPVLLRRKHYRSANHIRAFWPRLNIFQRASEPLRIRRKLGFWARSNIISGGGWHFSFLGDRDFVVDKLAAYSHQERNTPDIVSEAGDAVALALEHGRFLGQDEFKFRIAPLSELPVSVLADQSRYAHLLA